MKLFAASIPLRPISPLKNPFIFSQNSQRIFSKSIPSGYFPGKGITKINKRPYKGSE